jgi:type II secretory pathway pseudopilin PulG
MSQARFRKNEKGSALIYILIAIALLAALTVTFMEPSSQQTSTQNTFKTVTEIESQANVIRAAVQECVLSYPKGDQDISDPVSRKNYPIDPDSSYYSTASPGQSGDHLVRNIRCPGNNPGGSNTEDHELVFTGGEGKFLPPPPDLFEDWQYYNGPDGIFFWIETSKSDAFLLTALTKLDQKFSECESDIIDTTVAPTGAKELDSDGDHECATGSVCFRVWMVMNNTVAVFNGDADGDETVDNAPDQRDCSSAD